MAGNLSMLTKKLYMPLMDLYGFWPLLWADLWLVFHNKHYQVADTRLLDGTTGKRNTPSTEYLPPLQMTHVSSAVVLFVHRECAEKRFVLQPSNLQGVSWSSSTIICIIKQYWYKFRTGSTIPNLPSCFLTLPNLPSWLFPKLPMQIPNFSGCFLILCNQFLDLESCW